MVLTASNINIFFLIIIIRKIEKNVGRRKDLAGKLPSFYIHGRREYAVKSTECTVNPTAFGYE